jgi:hypothetical protein
MRATLLPSGSARARLRSVARWLAFRHATWLVALAPWLASCGAYSAELQRGQRYYERNEYEAALAVWRSLDANSSSLGSHEQTQYAYLRGMTDYRLGFRSEARHWLALAQANEHLHPGGLPVPWSQRLAQTLADLERTASGTVDRSENSGGPVQTIEATPPQRD